MNHVELRGTIVRDPELKYTPAGLAVLELQLAGTDHVRGDDDRIRALPWYHRVTIFGDDGADLVVADALAPGDALYVVGRLRYRSWEDGQGRRRSDVDVVADTTRLLGRPPEERVTRDARGQERLDGATNRVLLAGRTTRDAELRRTPSGHAVLNLGVAVNETVRDEERTHFVDVTAWRRLAEAHRTLAKGSGLVVTGRLVTDTWDGADGRKHFRTKVEASDLHPTVKPTRRSAYPFDRDRDENRDEVELPF